MGIALPQVVTSDRASGAQVIDGSLKFDKNKTTHVKRTPSSTGNRSKHTISFWVKYTSNDYAILSCGASSPNYFELKFNSSSQLELFGLNLTTTNTTAVFRDFSAWYHVTLVIDKANGTATERVIIYVNGVRQALSTASQSDTNNPYWNIQSQEHRIGGRSWSTSDQSDYQLSNLYLIDGQALGPENFGFTDPLTNTWRPKKFIVDPEVVQTVQPTYVSNSAVLDPANAFDGSSGTEATYSGVNSWISFTVSDASNLTVPFRIRNDSSGTGQTVAMFTDSGGSSAAGGTWGSTGTNNLSPAITTTVDDTYTFPSTGTYYLRHTVGSDSNIFVYKIGGDVTTGGFGTNGVYLPMDGNSPIGQDQSGKGNDFTPVNFGGSVALDNPQVSGARPILNTTQGGTQAAVGVFGSKQNVGYAVTVYNDGGGNKYYIDGVKQDTVTGLIRGATYTFDTSDSTVSSHPFRFSATSNGSHGGGSEYTNGVAAITGAATTITVPYNAPNTLYYYCTSHSGMGADITGITTNEKLTDQYASNCVLALPLVGSNGDVSVSVACTSATKAVTSTNAVASSAASNFYGGSWYFDGSGDYLTIPYAADTFSFGTGDFTIEAFVNMSAVAYTAIISSTNTGINATNHWLLGFSNTANMMSFKIDGSGNSSVTSDFSGYYSKWSHVAVSRESGTIRLFFDGVLKASATDNSSLTGDTGSAVKIGQRYTNQDAYSINGYLSDLRIYKGVAKYTSDFVVPATSPDILPDTPSGVSGSSKLTISPDTSTEGAVVFDGDSDYLAVTGPGTLAASSNWCIECTFYCTGNSSGTYRIMSANESAQGSEYFHMRIRNGQYQFYTSNANSLTGTASFFKWTHIAMTKSGTTVRAYVDGVQLWSTTDNNTDSITNLITGWGYGSEYFPGFISNARFVNGSSVYTSEFNPPVVPLTNITNTAYLFCQSNTSATAYAVSPGSITANGTAAASKFTPFNTDINTVRGQETGYATWNPLNKNGGSLSNGNLSLTSGGAANLSATLQIPTTGKWYWEYFLDGQTSGGVIGIADGSAMNGTALGDWTKIYGYSPNGNKYENASASSYGPTLATGDLVGVKYDADTRQLEFLKNNISQGVAYTVSGEYDYYPSIHGNSIDVTANFGQKPFKFPPPAGFQPLNAANVRPETVITRPDQYVGVTTYSGTGSTKSVTGVGHSPDFLWAKARGHSDYHTLIDSVRGTSKTLYSNATDIEGTDATGVTSFDRDGFSLGANSTAGSVNVSGRSYVAWTWKAGGNKNTFNVDDVGYASFAASGTTAGTITPTGTSIGTKQGFSIIKYQGTGANATIPHGLSQSLDFVIVKTLTDGSINWTLWHNVLAGTEYLTFTSNEKGSQAAVWNSTVPTSSVINVGTDVGTNKDNDNYIAYCWHNVPGLQKFGSYTGVNSAAKYVELGFRPALLVIKFYDGTDVGAHAGWKVIDNQRNKFNISGIMQKLAWDVSEAENGGTTISTSEGKVDFLSNGFRILDNHSPFNTAGRNYIYMAWAEAPTVNLYGGQSNAR